MAKRTMKCCRWLRRLLLPRLLDFCPRVPQQPAPSCPWRATANASRWPIDFKSGEFPRIHSPGFMMLDIAYGGTDGFRVTNNHSVMPLRLLSSVRHLCDKSSWWQAVQTGSNTSGNGTTKSLRWGAQSHHLEEGFIDRISARLNLQVKVRVRSGTNANDGEEEEHYLRAETKTQMMSDWHGWKKIHVCLHKSLCMHLSFLFQLLIGFWAPNSSTACPGNLLPLQAMKPWTRHGVAQSKENWKDSGSKPCLSSQGIAEPAA